MRNAFIEQLNREASKDSSILLMVGDLGYSVVESFQESFPKQYLNAGIAEQNMAGMAAGLGLTGNNVFIYTIANFPTLRCLEQIRNDICYHNANVKIVSVGAGLAYGALGYSHHAVQDLACLRGFPGIQLATPGDPLEAKALTRYLCQHNGPAYLRLGKAGETVVHKELDPDQEIPYPWFPVAGPGTGKKVALCCGSMLAAVAPLAAQYGFELQSAALWGDDEATKDELIRLVNKSERVVVIEEHLMAGGFGSFLRECLESHNMLQSRVQILALNQKACGSVGSQNYLRQIGGLSLDNLIQLLKQ